MKEIFLKVKKLIDEENFAALNEIKYNKPESFNWVKEIFEGIHLQERPEKTALLWTDGSNTKEYSFRGLSNECNQILNFLRKKGVQQHDVVLTQMMLEPVNWTTILAVIKGGLQLIPAASILGSKDIAYRFEKTLPMVVFANEDNAPKIDEAEKLTGKSIKVKILVDGNREGWYSLDDIARESTEAEAADTSSDDTLFMFFTSGTTGLPKIVCHSQLSQPFGHLTTASWIGLKESDIHYNISQPGWAKFSWSSFFAPWNIGSTIFSFHTNDRFNAARTLEQIQKHKITTLCAPPTVLRLLINEDLESYKFSLRQCVAAGEPLNPEVIEQWKSGTGIVIRDGFGQTETSCIVGNLPGNIIKFGSMGKPTFMYNVVIADENGNEQPLHEEGNICIKMNKVDMNGVFKGYLYAKDKEEQVFKHGLYYTGDKAYKDEDGYIWFIGRDDDVIKASDYRIGPFEVESILIEHEAVLESAVVGSPHPVKGFEVKAFIILQTGIQASEELAEQLFSFSREHLAPYKIPRIIEFVQELPKTISGKIRRVELRARESENKTKGLVSSNEYIYQKK
ncbi:TPA: AMP-binding protein [Elizabethkingia anophelis]|nr:AMP-binding protein [Elizabethkingia anophelis]HBN6707348.1 AMP-binding protein [Elizabethkingia anophelis]HBN6711382.1 AMP-binding protein [Elizabethkingia anophelis]HBN6714168.1 AMP-binding protein [Elizabethkingia anophelis]HBN6719706.1 AMP-binding protein [Elizabethkingia anophelis]